MCAMLALAACVRNTAVKERLLAVESIIEEYPDSALAVLRSMDSVSVHKMEETQALHALLLSQAFDKNYIDVKDDSLISIAVRYYEESDDIFHRMLAHFYHGRVLYNASNYPQSLISTLQAFQEAESLDDKFWVAMSARNLSDIYNKTHHGPEGIKYARIASDNFKVSGHDIHHLWAIADLATAYNNNGDYDSSIVVAQELLDSAINHSNNSLQTIATRLIGRSYFGRDKYAEAIPYYIKVCSDNNRATVEDSAHLAILYLNNNQTKEAEILLNAISDKEAKCSQWMQYEIYSKTGKTDKALSSLKKERTLINNDFKRIIQQNLNGALSDYNAAQELKREAEIRTIQLYFALSTIAALILIFTAILFIYRQRAKTERYINLAKDLEANLKSVRKDNTETQNHLRDILKSKFTSLTTLLSAYQGLSTNEDTKQKIVIELDKLIAEFSISGTQYKKLEEDVNLHAANLMSNLRKHTSGWKEIDYILYLYSALGFTTPALTMFLEAKDANAIYNRKKRIREKLKDLPDNLSQYYLSFLQ